MYRQKRQKQAPKISRLDIGDVPPISHEVMKRLFKLTCCEANVAQCLARGETLHAAADSLGISIETARNHLKSIFSKTNTHRQHQLVVLIIYAK